MHKLLFAVFVVYLNVGSVFADHAIPTLAVSNVTRGPAQKLGQDLNNGAQLYFSQSSASHVNFQFKNDGYEPEQALLNTKYFVEQGHTLLFNFVGTPTTKAIANHIHHLPILLVTPFTGADFLRVPEARHVFNLRASYQQEAEFHSRYLINQLGLRKIGIVLQADDYGLSFTKYFERELAASNLMPVLLTRVKRNSQFVSTAVEALKRADIEAVVFIGTYEPLTEIINQTFSDKPDLIYASVSFAASDHVLPQIPDTAKVFFTEVVPDPNSCDFDECHLFRSLAGDKYSSLTRGQFEGFINALWLDSAISACDQVSLGCISDKLTYSSMTLFGESMVFDENSRQLANRVFYSSQNVTAPVPQIQ